MSAEITLYGYTTSPFVRKVSCYLYYKGLQFNFVGVSPVEPNKTIGFSGGTQVPVVKIGDKWRTDSSPIGHWIEELYPEKPLLGKTATDRETIVKIDDWASEQFIPGMIFRSAVDGEKNEAFKKRAWRLAEIVSSGATLPDHVKEAWPDIIATAPFIQRMVNELDLSEPLLAMQQRIIMELADHLGDGPFLGGLDAPSLADFAVYPQIMFNYQVGLINDLILLEHPTLGPWLERVGNTLPRNPWCVDESFIVNEWPF